MRQLPWRRAVEQQRQELHLAAGRTTRSPARSISAPPHLRARSAPRRRCRPATRRRCNILFGFLENVGSFNLGVAGGGNPIDGNIGADREGGAGGRRRHALAPRRTRSASTTTRTAGPRLQCAVAAGHPHVQPYMHNGACETVACVVGDLEHRTANGRFPDKLSIPGSQIKVVRFVELIDAQTQPFLP